ncbi:glycosyltransferase family 4 protein [Frankia sp. AgB1.9]|uniref:glycosyltransferase family 4 protein n=1 Tax=unclassified Frankia TaxID=2632575 RepID=UPI0019322ED2|nr:MULTISPECIES: glycosyltransferase family 4 protein [unclassified Frankia]MBL7494289.1 glycosyltransferase family 4 protein [Frankia sp. AgW1.1]MBL7552510.1 glycosyltransferase family 4 protein [Frankia sp. AgB1.9]MBL7625275.1 glycosyltransferase family 4 protein [Frankia sp. AgB1.8]
MKIALIAPVEEAVPPPAYGGVEQVVHLLDRELTRRGHDVLLLASGGSRSAGRLVALLPAPLGAPHQDRDSAAYGAAKTAAARTAAEVIERERPDAVLCHTWRYLEHAVLGIPTLTTVHYPLDTPPYREIFAGYPAARYVSVSLSQQRLAPRARFIGNVYNGVDVASLPFIGSAGRYLAFLGRFSPDKGVDIAIRAAQRAGIPLRIGAKLDRGDREWFAAVIEPLVRRGGVELVGEISAADKGAFLGGALGLVHPSRWNEPFGLAAVEAMACGTPVVALRRGAAEEIVADGETGFVVEEEDAVVSALAKISNIDRAVCRAHVHQRFSQERMGAGYESLLRSEANRAD